MTEFAVSALSRKRGEVAGEIIAREAALDQLRADLVHLDAAIRIMRPDAEPELIRPRKPSRKGCDWFGRQELPRLVLGSLRGTEQPLSCIEIARAVMTCKGLDAADRTALQRIVGMVKGALHRRDGRMLERVGNGRDVRWRISAVSDPGMSSVGHERTRSGNEHDGAEEPASRSAEPRIIGFGGAQRDSMV